MSTRSSLQFFDFPYEIQELILWKCLEGWKATVEIHEKPLAKKSTTRLWSSVIYDALMLSLTCRHFHAIIQKIQKDPRLFNGEVDLIEANAEMSYLVGLFTSNTNNYYIVERDSVPRPLYRTQIFIKASPYDRSDPDWRTTRLKYHAGVRNWLNQNVRSLALWADEMTSRVPWELFPRLENVTVYWPSTYLQVSDPRLHLCEHSKEDFVSMAKAPRNLMSAWDLRAAIPEFERVSKLGLRITVKYDVPHAHASDIDVGADDFNETYQKLLSIDYYNLECTFTVQNGDWTQTSIFCHGQLPVELKAEEVRKFLELGQLC